MTMADVGLHQGVAGAAQADAAAVAFVEIVSVKVTAVLDNLRHAGLTGRADREGGNLCGGEVVDSVVGAPGEGESQQVEQQAQERVMQPDFAKRHAAVTGDNGETIEDEVNGAGDKQGAEVELAAENSGDKRGGSDGKVKDEGFVRHERDRWRQSRIIVALLPLTQTPLGYRPAAGLP
ncbi:hypothetical protein HMPREF9080_00873 [Cardiobacterium valvarum F0432]|uniref:Uncharacterized protein n=1 Tax=Cardiobacterium valvarum F0432 TaxID=797473 RepID=G9ZDN9_9GAMM|nr:hypothetical protein HMPREF9080_00873 [Cardiobacterium valvarum F0432]